MNVKGSLFVLFSCVLVRSQRATGIGRLMVNVVEGIELKPCRSHGKSNPYCEVTMGSQCHITKTIQDTLNPKWNSNCQFFIRDLEQEVLCITVFERDQFSPDGECDMALWASSAPPSLPSGTLSPALFDLLDLRVSSAPPSLPSGHPWFGPPRCMLFRT